MNPLDFSQADLIISEKGNVSVSSLTVNEYVAVTRAIIHRTGAEVAPPLYTRKDLLEKLGVSYPTLLRYESKGLFTGFKVGRKMFFNQEAVDSVLKTSEV